MAANSFMNPFIYAAKVSPHTSGSPQQLLAFQVKAFRNILRGYITKFNKPDEPETEVTESAL